VDRVREIEFDVTLVGGDGLVSLAYVRPGKKAVYLGGATQVMFVTRGIRWHQWRNTRNGGF
jgi:hypothetical protein